jgi:hypothetical protein
VREDELAVVPFIEIELAMGFRPVSIERTVPRGATHAFRNASVTPVRFLNTHRPALTFQDFLETVDGLIRAGR